MKKKETLIANNVNNESEDLLADPSSLSKMIEEGDSDDIDASPIASSEAVPVVEGEPQQEEINVHSDNPNMKWYIIYTRTGFEMKAKNSLEQRIKQENMSEYFTYVLVPSESVVEVNKGKKKTSKRKFFPGYMLVQMILNEHTWHFVKSTARVVGFVGDNLNPTPVSEKEVMKIVSQIKQGVGKSTPKVSFDQGETVRVTEGPFTNFTGIVEEVRPEKAKLRVLVSIFGRSTPVELEFMQVEKI